MATISARMQDAGGYRQQTGTFKKTLPFLVNEWGDYES